MERGVVVGGLLVSVSLLIAVMLNSNDNRGAMPIGSTDAEQAAGAAAITRANSAAGSCHVAPDPANRAAVPAHPGRQNIKGAGAATACSK